jgi:hypothetical protein
VVAACRKLLCNTPVKYFRMDATQKTALGIGIARLMVVFDHSFVDFKVMLGGPLGV